ncbi:sodium:solute symporter family protein [Rhodoplanes sp. TEM]|uniref:Sodium:solute symporter family protein n=1 Tax=Rhodoplanes tepidamans TaxID=200616 RepID=A0ABT5JB14_RHOTP|nr:MULTISPECIES: sodium:solute symporter family protein [Rhodoplanes]MDC7786791.1 sodium:solute symporter family protein [Rhodoplanes tepidamans]MDC7987845.1 sodium:solute symporter family protein [Rhodoplanes sp. TEM]MDQ0355918.1 SSS family solute:Na+ symporter [Rhodoplanes tepidamans]
MLSLSFSQVAGLAGTVLLVVAFGAWSSRKVRSAQGYSLNGRSAGAILIAGSISGTAVGGSSTVGTAQMAASFGLSGWWFTLGTGIALLVLAVFYARPLRRSGLETIPQYLTIPYGRSAGPLASLVSSLGILFSAVASALAGIHLMVAMFGLAPWLSAVVLVALVLAYGLFGGLKGAGVSGILKMAVLWLSLWIAGLYAAVSLAQLPDFDAQFPAFPWFSLWGRGAGETLYNLMSLIVGVVCTQTYVQAIYAASDTRVAAVGAATAALITIPIGLPSIAVGMFMHARHPELAPVLALPVYLIQYLPGVLGGIGLAGILISVVGSIAGLALGIGTMMANDIGRGLFGLTDDATILMINRACVLGVGAVSMLIALSALDSYVLDWNYMSMALRGAAVFLPLSLAVFCPGRLSAPWAIASMIGSTAAAVAVRLVVPLPINPLMTGLAVSAGVVGIGLLRGSATKRRDPPAA